MGVQDCRPEFEFRLLYEASFTLVLEKDNVLVKII